MRGGRLGVMLPRRERRGGGTAESTHVDRAEGPKRERAEEPKRERSAPVLLSYRREAFKRGKVARSGQERQADRAEGPRGKKGGQGEASGPLLGYGFMTCGCDLGAGRRAFSGMPRNALLCLYSPALFFAYVPNI